LLAVTKYKLKEIDSGKLAIRRCRLVIDYRSSLKKEPSLIGGSLCQPLYPSKREATGIELLIQAADPATLPQWKANLLLVLMSTPRLIAV